MSDMNLFMN